jgi:glycine/D-amino acid oxidase-like deaminating enzyme
LIEPGDQAQQPNIPPQTARPRTVVVVGGGLVGRACAWQLQQRGHHVQLLDPGLHGDPDPNSGSWAALGVLMAQVFHRSGGRGWRLRQRSLSLWNLWRQQLGVQGWPLAWRPGLLLLAGSDADLERHQRLVASRQRQGLALELWGRPQLDALAPALPAGAVGGLYSPADGQLDPGPALDALLGDGLRLGLQLCCDRAERLERHPGGWTVHTGGGQALRAEVVVVSAGVASAALLGSLGHSQPQEPVLGQALELEAAPTIWDTPGPWPGAVLWQGINLVPRAGSRLWLGATLEPGEQADPAAMAQLRQLGDTAPTWLQQAAVIRRWQGQRAHPIGQPAPLLAELEPGLLLASGHYRNGVLLAPATAEWVADQLERPSA